MVGDIEIKKEGGKIDYSHQQQIARFPKNFYWTEKRDTKQLTSYPDSLKLQILLYYKLGGGKGEEYCKE